MKNISIILSASLLTASLYASDQSSRWLGWLTRRPEVVQAVQIMPAPQPAPLPKPYICDGAHLKSLIQGCSQLINNNQSGKVVEFIMRNFKAPEEHRTEALKQLVTTTVFCGYMHPYPGCFNGRPCHETLLHIAVRNKLLSFAQTCIEWGSNVDQANCDNGYPLSSSYPLCTAVESKEFALIDLLIKHDAWIHNNVVEILSDSCIYQYLAIETVQKLIAQHTMHVNSSNKDWNTILHLLALECTKIDKATEKFDFFLKQGADTKIMNVHGQTVETMLEKDPSDVAKSMLAMLNAHIQGNPMFILPSNSVHHDEENSNAYTALNDVAINIEQEVS